MKFMIFGLNPVGIILGVALLLLLAGFSAEAMETAEIGEDIHEFELAVGLVNTTAGENDFAIITSQVAELGPVNWQELTTPIAIKFGIFPSNMVQGGKAMNPWGGKVILDHTPEGQLYLYTDKLPKEVCRVIISGRDMMQFPYVGVNWTDMTDAKSAVNNCDDGENTVTFSFARDYPMALLESASH